MDLDRIGAVAAHPFASDTSALALSLDDHEAAYFAKAAGISRDQAKLLIRQHGSHRATLLAAARRLKHA